MQAPARCRRWLGGTGSVAGRPAVGKAPRGGANTLDDDHWQGDDKSDCLPEASDWTAKANRVNLGAWARDAARVTAARLEVWDTAHRIPRQNDSVPSLHGPAAPDFYLLARGQRPQCQFRPVPACPAAGEPDRRPHPRDPAPDPPAQPRRPHATPHQGHLTNRASAAGDRPPAEQHLHHLSSTAKPPNSTSSTRPSPAGAG